LSEWISVKDRMPVTGALCLIVYAGVVQSVGYRRMGIGFACEGGYEWEDAHEEGDPIPDYEVTHWMHWPDLPDGRG
jgi:hypothetical protein